jgi:hypothetical protein
MSPRRCLIWTGLFALAFGWVEAAIVVYLRELYYPEGFTFPFRRPEAMILATELVREAASLLMLLVVAVLAGRRFWERFGFFAFVFGIWDLSYYMALKVILGWPSTLADLDILFLLPLPWVGPVYAPMAVAGLLIISGIVVVHLSAAGYELRADRWTWLLGIVGMGLLLYSFMRDIDAGLGKSLPQPYPLWLFSVGFSLLVVCCLRFVLVSLRRKWA